MATGDTAHVSPFKAIRQSDEHGDEYWSARDLARVLGYAKWDKFENVIDRGSFETRIRRAGQPSARSGQRTCKT